MHSLFSLLSRRRGKIMSNNVYLMKQWAAVRTQFLWMRVPPQVWKNVGSGRLSGQTWNKIQQKSLCWCFRSFNNQNVYYLGAADLSDPINSRLKVILIEYQLIIKDASLFHCIPQLLIHTKTNIFRIPECWMCVSALDLFHTCMDTCQGQELGLARSPFTIRASRVGGMAGFPQLLGQSEKCKQGKPTVTCAISGSPLMYGFICGLFVNTNNAWIQSTHLQLEDKCVLLCTASGWLF